MTNVDCGQLLWSRQNVLKKLAWIFNLRPQAHERGLNLSKFPNLIQNSEKEILSQIKAASNWIIASNENA